MAAYDALALVLSIPLLLLVSFLYDALILRRGEKRRAALRASSTR